MYIFFDRERRRFDNQRSFINIAGYFLVSAVEESVNNTHIDSSTAFVDNQYKLRGNGFSGKQWGSVNCKEHFANDRDDCPAHGTGESLDETKWLVAYSIYAGWKYEYD